MILKVATILDDFSWHCFRREFDESCNLHLNDEFDSIIPGKNFLLIESAWEGKDKSWGGAIFGPNYNIFEKLILVCKANSVPIVYFSKEDPIDYLRFRDRIAKHADLIFTTAEECVDRYKKDLRIDNVFVMPFAASTYLHYPSSKKRIKKIAFAGTYWSGAHPERKKYLDMMFEVASEMNMLHIWDRNYETPSSDRPDRLFPESQRVHIQGGLPFDKIGDCYRSYLAFFNSNIISRSKTMFSRRVFEIMSCGTPVITSPADGIDNLLGSAAITVRSKSEIKNAINNLQKPEIWENVSLNSAKAVLSKHTYTHRVMQICNAIGIDWKEGKEKVRKLESVSRCKNLTEIEETVKNANFPLGDIHEQYNC